MGEEVAERTGITGSLEQLAIDSLYGIINIFTSVVDVLVSALVDALIWLFHTALMKPLVSEFIGDFMINDDMLSLKETEMMGLLLNYFYQKMQIIAIATLILIASWQLFKLFFAYFGQSATEEGWKIGLKMILYGVLIFKAKDICLLVIRMFNEVEQSIGGIALTSQARNSATYISTMKGAIESIYNILENTEFSRLETYGELVKFCLILAIDFELLKIAIDMAEKYMNVMLMIVISPVAFACGVTKATNRFFSKWVSFFVSGMLYQVLQYIMICMLHSIATGATRKADTTTYIWGGEKNVLVEGVSAFRLLFIVWGILSLGRNAVSIIDELGFSSLGEGANQLARFVRFMPANKLYNGIENLAKKKKKKKDDDGSESQSGVGAKFDLNYEEDTNEGSANFEIGH